MSRVQRFSSEQQTPRYTARCSQSYTLVVAGLAIGLYQPYCDCLTIVGQAYCMQADAAAHVAGFTDSTLLEKWANSNALMCQHRYCCWPAACSYSLHPHITGLELRQQAYTRVVSSSTRIFHFGYHFHLRSSSPVIFGFCDIANGHFCCSLSLTGCRVAGSSHCCTSVKYFWVVSCMSMLTLQKWALNDDIQKCSVATTDKGCSLTARQLRRRSVSLSFNVTPVRVMLEYSIRYSNEYSSNELLDSSSCRYSLGQCYMLNQR